jgi:parallel beta-helix repeat protein
MARKTPDRTSTIHLQRTAVVLTIAFLLAVGATGAAAAQTDLNDCTAGSILIGGDYEISDRVDTSTSGDCLDVATDNVVIEGNGNIINGTEEPGSVGLRVEPLSNSISNITVRNLTVSNFETGVSVKGSEDVELVGVGVSSTETSVSVENSTDVTVDSAVLSDTDVGVRGFESENVTVENSFITSNELVTLPPDFSLPDYDFPTDPELPDNLGAQNRDDTDPTYEDDEVGVEQTHNTPRGVVLNGTKNSGVLGNAITGVGVGVEVISSEGLTIAQTSSNDIVGNDITESYQGVSIVIEETDGIGTIDTNSASSNEVVDNNVRDNDIGISVVRVSSGIPQPLSQPTSNGVSNHIVGNEVVDNEDGILVDGMADGEISDNMVLNSTEDGIVLELAGNNEVNGNTVEESGRYGVWLEGSSGNELRNNVAEENDEAGIYLGGNAAAAGANNNVLVNNTARNSEYGIWLSNSFDNDVSESLAENNHEGITVEETTDLFSEEVESKSIEASGNTFTDDVSRNNDWDFVAETEKIGGVLSATSTSGYPVTNLNIGASTEPDTVLSFGADDVRLSSADSPEPDPDGTENVGRYFEAEDLSADWFLNVSVGYDDGDVSGVNESTLELQRFVTTEWTAVPGSSVETDDNLVGANITDFATGNFGVFGESDAGDGSLSPDNPFGDANNEPLAINDAADVLFQWNQNDGTVNGTDISLSDMADFLFEWNQARN